MTESAPTTSRLRSTGRWAASISVIVVLAFGAVVYTNSRGTEQVVADAGALQAAEASLGAADVHLKSLGQLVLLTTDRALGVATDEVVAAAVVETETSRDRLHATAARMAKAVGVTAEVDPILDASSQIMAAATAGDTAEASRLLVEVAVPANDQFTAAALAERNRLVSAVTKAGTSSGRWSRVAGFLTAFFVPLIAMLAYRRVVQRQLKLAEVQLDARLSAEHEVVKAKDQFIADISHELRTPLTSIYGFSEVLLDEGLFDPATAKDLVRLINRESGELARMVEDLLVAARDPASEIALELGTVDVAEVVRDTAEVFTRNGRQIDLIISDAEVLGDRLRIRQIIRNLLSNVERYGGDEIRIVGRHAGDAYTLTVKDNGSGVPRAMVPRLFTRFVHTGGQALTSGSVGLGLAVASRLARGMGGSLTYHRSDGWSSFRITLPLAEGAARPSRFQESA